MASQYDLAAVLKMSLDPGSAREAERNLKEAESYPGFAISLLQLISSDNVEFPIRLAGALFFKNFIKRKWTNEEGKYILPIEEVVQVKKEIVFLMISLPPSLQVQVGEAISIMADSDFPDRWENLIDDLVSRLSDTNIRTNNGVFEVAHSIFKRWRPLYRSNALFAEIKLVLDKFCVPFLKVFKHTDELISQNSNNKENLELLFQSLLLITKIFYDLNCQDIPEFFEDNLNSLFEILYKYLNYSNPLLSSDDDTEVSIVEKVKASIFEILTLYTQRYEDVFNPLLSNFAEVTWNLLTNTGMEVKYDILVSKALIFLTCIAKISSLSSMFTSEKVVTEVVERIILPNSSLRESDEELFEDDPIEYIRRDLEGSNSDTRRRATTDFFSALKEHSEHIYVPQVLKYIDLYLGQYNENKENWKSKDTAIFLFLACAIKGTLTASGVNSTNPDTDIVGFFTKNVAPDLMESSANVNPILQVDAIKFIYVFRNQLSKQQLFETFPLLSSKLLSSEYVVYTYAAITIEKFLSMHTHNTSSSGNNNNNNNSTLLFSKADIAPVAQKLLENLFLLISKSGNTPEKIAENEFLMKCVMRIIMSSQDTIPGYAPTLLNNIVNIITIIVKNPSNPRFLHYTFESLAGIIRYYNATLSSSFESTIVPILLEILSQDITEFIPYSFQILSQILELIPKSSGLPLCYQQLIKPLLSPALWEAKGNAPGLTRLLESILTHDVSFFVRENHLTPLLGVFQKLHASKINDSYGFDLLRYIFLNIPLQTIQPHLKTIATLQLQRLQAARSEKYIILLAKWVYFLASITTTTINNNVINTFGADFAIEFYDSVQNGIFGDIFSQFISPSTSKISGTIEKKIAIVGLTNILTNSDKFISGQYVSKWNDGINSLITTIGSGIPNTKVLDYENILTDLDAEDLAFGASFVKINVASPKPFDPISLVTSVNEYVKKMINDNISKLSPLINQLPGNTQQALSLLS